MENNLENNMARIIRAIASTEYEQLLGGIWYWRKLGIVAAEYDEGAGNLVYKDNNYCGSSMGTISGAERRTDILHIRIGKNNGRKYYRVQFIFDHVRDMSMALFFPLEK